MPRQGSLFLSPACIARSCRRLSSSVECDWLQPHAHLPPSILGEEATQQPLPSPVCTEVDRTEVMDNLPPDIRFDDLALGEDDLIIDEDEDDILRLLRDVEEEGEEDSLAPRPTQGRDVPSPTLGYGLVDVCKRAAAKLKIRTLNVTTLLMVYQKLNKNEPNPLLREEICVVSDLNLRASTGAIQGCGRVIRLPVVEDRVLRLNLSSLTGETADFLDAPIEPKELFGPIDWNCTEQEEKLPASACPANPGPTPVQPPQP